MTNGSLKTGMRGWGGIPILGAEFTPRHIHRAARNVTRLLGEMDSRPLASVELLDALHVRISESWTRHGKLSHIAHRDLRRLPWILFYPAGSLRARWLGADVHLAESFGTWLRNGRRMRVGRALLYEFLRVYPTDLDTFDRFRQILAHAIFESSSSPSPSLANWRSRCTDYGLLEPRGSERFVTDLLAVPSAAFAGSCEDVLSRAGLDTGLATCGFLRSGIISILTNDRNLVMGRGGRSPRLVKLLELLVLDGNLRFGDREMRSAVAHALLGPFVAQSPHPETRTMLKLFFLTHYGHPNLPSGMAKWLGVPEDPKRVLIRWVVRDGMENFLRLIRECADDSHWRFREAFWRAFLDAGLIDDIWFVLGPQARRMLARISGDHNAMATTGELMGRRSPDQSVLLLRLPGVTAVEWSHSGSCHLWLDGHPSAPPLYGPRYGADALRRPYPYPVEPDAHSQRHDGSPAGRWQGAIAAWLRSNTGIRLDRDRYFPRELRGGAGYGGRIGW